MGNSGTLSSSDMDLGFPIEFVQGSQASSSVEAWISAFHSNCERDVRPPVEFRWGIWAFSRGSARESGLPSCCEEILTVPLKVVQRNHE